MSKDNIGKSFIEDVSAVKDDLDKIGAEDFGVVEAYKHLKHGDKIIREIDGKPFVMYRDGIGGVEYVGVHPQ